MLVLEGDNEFKMERLLGLPKPTKAALSAGVVRLLHADVEEGLTSDEEDVPVSRSEGEDEWDAVLAPATPKPRALPSSSLKTRVAQEFKNVIQEGIRGAELEKVYKILKAIPASSVESERKFSSMNLIHTTIRSA